MSTRALIHFVWGNSKSPEAMIYRHSDGYPEGLGEDLKRFLDEVEKQTSDTRFNDPSYLAAKWVVFDAEAHCQNSRDFPGVYGIDSEHTGGNLCFLGVGVICRDPGGIEYRYIVRCHANGRPTIEVQEG